jgi:hypothetical protein
VCRFIDAEKASGERPGGYSVVLMCRVLGLPRSTYYAHCAARPARRVRDRELLVGEIRVLHAGSRGAYGVPRVHAALVRAGRPVNRKRVERLMREHGIEGVTRRRRRGLTRQEKRAVFAVDLIGRDFTAPRPGMRMVGDMTELATGEGKLYLATCIDLGTREIRLFCCICGCDHAGWRRGRVGRLPPRQSMTSAMIASAVRKPKPRRMMRRVLVFVDSMRPLLNSSTMACMMAS